MNRHRLALQVNSLRCRGAVQAEAGVAVTFDNWGTMGTGADAVVIYDIRGKLVRAMGLGDFLPKYYIEALPRSVSSIWWSGVHRFSADSRQLILSVVVPREGQTAWGDAEHVELRFDLTHGRSLHPDTKAWSRALASAQRISRALHKAQVAAGAE